MSQFYVKAEDDERCLQSSITRRPIMVQGLTTEGKLLSLPKIISGRSNDAIQTE